MSGNTQLPSFFASQQNEDFEEIELGGIEDEEDMLPLEEDEFNDLSLIDPNFSKPSDFISSNPMNEEDYQFVMEENQALDTKMKSMFGNLGFEEEKPFFGSSGLEPSGSSIWSGSGVWTPAKNVQVANNPRPALHELPTLSQPPPFARPPPATSLPSVGLFGQMPPTPALLSQPTSQAPTMVEKLFGAQKPAQPTVVKGALSLDDIEGGAQATQSGFAQSGAPVSQQTSQNNTNNRNYRDLRTQGNNNNNRNSRDNTKSGQRGNYNNNNNSNYNKNYNKSNNNNNYRNNQNKNNKGLSSDLPKKPNDKEQRTQFRVKWKDNRQYMRGSEIDSIIRMHEFQLSNAANNVFAEDIYYQWWKKKQQTEVPLRLHKPLYESSTKTTTQKQRKDPLEGVLGRVSTISVRHPRPVLDIKRVEDPSDLEEKTGSGNQNDSFIHMLLLTIENAFMTLLDIEDVENLIRQPESPNHFNMQQLMMKKEELTAELFKSFHVYVTGDLPQKSLVPEELYIFPQDAVFITLTLVVPKGKKLVVRALPLLFQQQVLAIYFCYLRNLSTILTSPRLDPDSESTSALFDYLLQISSGGISQTILALQTVTSAHLTPQLIKILQSKFGLNLVQTILKRGHDLNLSPFSREEALSVEIRNSELATAGFHWKDIVAAFVQSLRKYFVTIFTPENTSNNKIWEFLAVLAVNINPKDKMNLLTEISDIIKSSPTSPTLLAFLELAAPRQ